jgi:MFS family permease
VTQANLDSLTPAVNSPGGNAFVFDRAWATRAFIALFAMNLLDYLDRWTLTGVLTHVQREFGVDDTAAGSLMLFFLLSYTLISPFMGILGDRMKRTWLLAIGIGVWSLATFGTGLVQTFDQMKVARSFLGIGEATYGILAPTILMDLYPRDKRSRVLSFYYMAMPFGYALGMALGGIIAEHSPRWFAGTPLEPYAGWRMAFFLVGIPGFIAAISALFLREPVRGLSEGVDPARLRQHERVGATRADYLELLVNSSYTYTVFGLAAFTFAFGGLAFWLKSYLERVKGIPGDQAGLLLGATGLSAMILGMIGGGWISDRLWKRILAAPLWVSGTSMLLAVPCILIGLYSTNLPIIITFLFFAQLFMFANIGPANAVIASVIMPNMRATAYAICNFTIHFLGDVWSPLLMGMVSDYCGQPSVMETPLGRFLSAIGAESVDGKNLAAGMYLVVPAVLLGAAVLLAGTRHLPREMALMLARLRATPHAES